MAPDSDNDEDLEALRAAALASRAAAKKALNGNKIVELHSSVNGARRNCNKPSDLRAAALTTHQQKWATGAMPVVAAVPAIGVMTRNSGYSTQRSVTTNSLVSHHEAASRVAKSRMTWVKSAAVHGSGDCAKPNLITINTLGQPLPMPTATVSPLAVATAMTVNNTLGALAASSAQLGPPTWKRHGHAAHPLPQRQWGDAAVAGALSTAASPRQNARRAVPDRFRRIESSEEDSESEADNDDVAKTSSDKSESESEGDNRDQAHVVDCHVADEGKLCAQADGDSLVGRAADQGAELSQKELAPVHCVQTVTTSSPTALLLAGDVVLSRTTPLSTAAMPIQLVSFSSRDGSKLLSSSKRLGPAITAECGASAVAVQSQNNIAVPLQYASVSSTPFITTVAPSSDDLAVVTAVCGMLPSEHSAVSSVSVKANMSNVEPVAHLDNRGEFVLHGVAPVNSVVHESERCGSPSQRSERRQKRVYRNQNTVRQRSLSRSKGRRILSSDGNKELATHSHSHRRRHHGGSSHGGRGDETCHGTTVAGRDAESSPLLQGSGLSRTERRLSPESLGDHRCFVAPRVTSCTGGGDAIAKEEVPLSCDRRRCVLVCHNGDADPRKLEARLQKFSTLEVVKASSKKVTAPLQSVSPAAPQQCRDDMGESKAAPCGREQRSGLLLGEDMDGGVSVHCIRDQSPGLPTRKHPDDDTARAREPRSGLLTCKDVGDNAAMPRIGGPKPGRWRQRLTSDSAHISAGGAFVKAQDAKNVGSAQLSPSGDDDGHSSMPHLSSTLVSARVRTSDEQQAECLEPFVSRETSAGGDLSKSSSGKVSVLSRLGKVVDPLDKPEAKQNCNERETRLERTSSTSMSDKGGSRRKQAKVRRRHEVHEHLVTSGSSARGGGEASATAPTSVLLHKRGDGNEADRAQVLPPALRESDVHNTRAAEAELDARIRKIKEQNAAILKRKQLVEAEKKRMGF